VIAASAAAASASTAHGASGHAARPGVRLLRGGHDGQPPRAERGRRRLEAVFRLREGGYTASRSASVSTRAPTSPGPISGLAVPRRLLG
jgi:hypothetical protein